jgi:hypothetical protein
MNTKNDACFKTENLAHYGAEALNAERSFETSGISQ